jgi:hypothetical protein
LEKKSTGVEKTKMKRMNKDDTGRVKKRGKEGENETKNVKNLGGVKRRIKQAKRLKDR